MAGRVPEAVRGEPGGIVALADSIDEHRGAFEYDWRARFHKPLRVIGRSMSWGEALRLAQRLSRDPSSEVAAALGGWEHSSSREALILMDTYDALTAAHFKRPKPYPRPWPDRSKSRPKPTVSQAEVVAALQQAGHGELPAWASNPAE